MLIDIHTHTHPISDDSFLDPGQLIEQAKLMGLDGICITDHDRFWKQRDIEELSQKHDFLVLPGCEITTEDGHLLVYGLQEYIFGMHKASFVKDLVDEAGGAIIFAHPYRRNYRPEISLASDDYGAAIKKTCMNKAFSISDGIEISNGRGSARENTFSKDTAIFANMRGTGASDAHSVVDIGSYATEFEGDIQTLEDLINELRFGYYHPYSLGSVKRFT